MRKEKKMERFIGWNGQIYASEDEKKLADKEFETLCEAPVTDENIIKKSYIIDEAAEEMSCDEYYGDDDMIYALATQLYNYFDGDMIKAKDFYATARMAECYGIVDAIEWLKRI